MRERCGASGATMGPMGDEKTGSARANGPVAVGSPARGKGGSRRLEVEWIALAQRDNDNATDGCDIGCASPRGISIAYLRESGESGMVRA